MATKRKRKTKHRGNAVGAVEARGRTGRKPTPQETKRAARGRELKPPTWKGAFAKAVLGAVLLFILVSLGILGEAADTSQALLLCFFAMVAYTPIMFWTDRFIYQRKQRQLQGQGRRG